jgi:hypothetical protein
MKSMTKLLLTVMTAVFCCSIAKAQFSYSNAFYGGTLIYSNAFSGGAVDINGTAPTYINPNATNYGGSLGATFYVVTNSVPNGAYAYQNGTLGAHLNSVLLPLTLTNGYVYNFAATLTFTVTPPAGGWGGIGYATSLPIGKGVADARISALGGNPWTLLNMLANGGGAIFEINGATHSQVPNLMNSLNTPYVINLLVDTTTTNWTAAEYVAGTLIGTFTYTGHPSLVSFGYTQTTTTAGAFQWGPISISAVPLVITEEPASTKVNAGSSYTNTVIAGGQSPFFYQWYTNGVPIANATNASLVLNPVSGDEANSDYTVVVTNVYGAVTSTPASLVVYTSPQFLSANPITYTNLMTLLGGSGSYLGSSPSFSITAGGAQPMSYFWLTNGVAVGGASASTFTFTNCQMSSPTNFTCIISNTIGTATNVWLAQYIPTPTAPYPQAILADNPVAYWRLDETNNDPGQYNFGEICDDFMSGNNGFYTNTALAQPGYYVNASGINITNDPTETSAQFGPYDSTTGCDANSIGTNVDFSAFSNAEFTVSIWANGGYQYSSTEPVNGGILVKGYYGTEEYGLDCGGSGGTARFFIRTAANTVVGASSTFQLGGNNSWHHLVGVCDESNGVLNLYIDGLLTAQTAVAKGSGVLPEASEPITIGASTTAGTFNGDHQFDGALDDAAIFNYPLSANQVDALFEKSGGVNPLTFTAPVPSTNAVWRVNQTLTIPASALGVPPLGYYWTNVTTGGIVSGAGVHGATGTSVVSTITATLTITNAGASWSGDQLELVVTNATSSTNLFVTLFAYPPPITIGYTNSILYSNEFNGGTWNLAGTATTVANSLVGGTNTTWIDALGTNDTGNPGMYASGLDNTPQGNSWILPFTPETGFIYTITAQVTFSAWPGNWIGLGFCQNLVSNTTTARFDDNGPNGIDWILLQDSTGNTEFIDGKDNTFVTNVNSFFNPIPPNVGHTIQVVLDTTQPLWVQSAAVDGLSAGTNAFSSNPTLAGAGITQNTFTGNPNDVSWQYFALTAVSPNGFPPYLLNPAPSTNSIVLTNGTITVNATGYGSGPWGYSWINNSTVLTSGTTNITAPDVANLSIAGSALSSGDLELVMTNALGTNITVIPLVIHYAFIPIAWAVTNQSLYLSWPSADIGAQLQAQTNTVNIGLSTNWVDVSGSLATNKMVIPVNPANGTVFYRLHP